MNKHQDSTNVKQTHNYQIAALYKQLANILVMCETRNTTTALLFSDS